MLPSPPWRAQRLPSVLFVYRQRGEESQGSLMPRVRPWGRQRIVPIASVHGQVYPGLRANTLPPIKHRFLSRTCLLSPNSAIFQNLCIVYFLGYRHLNLVNEYGKRIPHATLFIHVDISPHRQANWRKIDLSFTVTILTGQSCWWYQVWSWAHFRKSVHANRLVKTVLIRQTI